MPKDVLSAIRRDLEELERDSRMLADQNLVDAIKNVVDRVSVWINHADDRQIKLFDSAEGA